MLLNNDVGRKDDSTSFYSNTFSTLSLANTSGVPAGRERGCSIRSPKSNNMRNHSMIELNAKKSNASNRMSIRFRNAVNYQ